MSDDLCPICQKGTLRVETTRVNRKFNTRTRYYRCGNCGYRPERKTVVSLDAAPVRIAMRKSWLGRKGRG